jgi:hypothetical protein
MHSCNNRFLSVFLQTAKWEPSLLLLRSQMVKYCIEATNSTKELQAFVLKYIDDNRVFSKEIVLGRKKAKEPAEPNAIDPNQTEPNSIEPNEG